YVLDWLKACDKITCPVLRSQLGKRDERKAAILLLLSQMMREPCFTELRTKQQIGWVGAA
ncbi:unnamed protein product, partial [Scytosiphon promiscuus]